MSPQNDWLIEEARTQRINLDEDTWVDMKTQISTGAYEDFQVACRVNGSSETIIYPPSRMLQLLIADWNLVDAEGIKVPLTLENFRRLSAKASGLILTKLTEALGSDNPLVQMDEDSLVATP